MLAESKETIYAQGAASDTIFYIRAGQVRLSVVAENGKEATLGILNPGDFFGEGCLTGQVRRMGAATAMTDCELMRIDKKAMMLALHQEHKLSDIFTAYLLGRNIRYEEDLVDQLFNSSEKRLARVLLLLAHFGKDGKPESVIPKISQETLAEMVGTTRSRVSFFMNRFRKMGLIDYGEGGLARHKISPMLVAYRYLNLLVCGIIHLKNSIALCGNGPGKNLTQIAECGFLKSCLFLTPSPGWRALTRRWSGRRNTSMPSMPKLVRSSKAPSGISF